MIYDRITSSLPPFLSRHVLALEASLAAKGGWMGRCELMDALDAYVAGMSTQPKPIVSAQKGAGTFVEYKNVEVTVEDMRCRPRKTDPDCSTNVGVC